jgi:hypothetical protein
LGDNRYLLPNAWFELAALRYEQAAYADATEYAAKAKSFKGYLLESRLHFRVHSLNDKITEALKGSNN